MRRGTTELERELPVKLTEHEIAERGESLAAKMLHIETLRSKLAAHNKSQKAIIDAELDEAQRLARTITNGVEQRKQSELFATDEVVPSQGESVAALAEVAERVELRYHGDGAICRKDPCKRRHLTPEQLDKAGIVREGQAIEPEGIASESDEDPRPKCSACGTVLTAIEVVKKLGLCETCWLQPHEDVEVPGIFEYEEREARQEASLRELREEGVELPATDNE